MRRKENEALLEKIIGGKDISKTFYCFPPIPEGYHHIKGDWNNGYVIERKTDGSQFTWIPVGFLESNGLLLYNKLSAEKFGRRKFSWYSIALNYYDDMTDEFVDAVQSVYKYGGFYLTSFHISKNEFTDKPQSKKGKLPWTCVTFHEAKEIASKLECSDSIKSHLTFGAEYDSVLQWFLQTGMSYDEIACDSSGWGNYYNSSDRGGIVETGNFVYNGIYDLAGNIREWTQEIEFHTHEEYVVRGGDYYVQGYISPAAKRLGRRPDKADYLTGFRAALYIK